MHLILTTYSPKGSTQRDVEALDAMDALRRFAPDYCGSTMTSVAARYGGRPYIDQAHSRDWRGRRGADARTPEIEAAYRAERAARALA